MSRDLEIKTLVEVSEKSINWDEIATKVLEKAEIIRDPLILAIVSNALYTAHFQGYHDGVRVKGKLQELEATISKYMTDVQKLIDEWKQLKGTTKC